MKEKILNDLEILENFLNDDEKFVTFFGSARFEEQNLYCKSAYELAKRLANSGFSIITGGGDGVMKAANKGAFEVIQNQKNSSLNSVGINVLLPNEQELNNFITKGSIFQTLSLRKVALIRKSLNFVVFPGGFGTLDELFEILVLIQCKKIDARVFLFGVEFYKPLIEFLQSSLLYEKAISKVDLSIFTLTDDINLIHSEIVNKGIR
ncbi:TIGR00730 family Rossman fold protein [Campylobacter sp. FMV-PI01]|uniref:Cytokinin riboside 5'-monophosphate phosphoribohydrolase n=1 Tax=Campylobacter portucalensis TaxID=2608384 RepID=A0A6L5WMW9_9BACT|nr:TIGR00730 family Rossman fold protein [Campylobacter portucalensis]MSN97153.1 TIGR00730 family Rossman fold protein [Campylobacter portucalensis]